jgi:aldehyde:ferredoxin oxidoreductase
MPLGYNGKILHVNLTTGELIVEEPEEKFYRHYMGGSAMALYYLFKNTPAGADPLGPENTLVMALSVITGAPISGLSRMTAAAKSPLTDVVGDSQCGGFWPAEMKFSGYDAIVFSGKADHPAYLWINSGKAELKDASHLWGKTTLETEEILKQELGDKYIQVLQIGPGGEKLVRYAAMINMANRANGRTGMGAVMGSKNLKAVVVRGKARPELADKEALLRMSKWGADNIENSDVYGLQKFGTAECVGAQNADGGLPTHNWDSGTFDGYQNIEGITMANTILTKNDTCYACTVRCKRVVEVKEGPFKVNPKYGGPEYETIGTFGSYCCVDNLAAVSLANQLCNAYGIDTISCGATIAWAMDCFEKGLITTADTGGLEIRFGDAEIMVKLTEMICRREGFGDLLAEGSYRAAQKIGRGTEKLVVAVKKQELPAHMPQHKRSLALIYAVNSFGADHESHEHEPAYLAYPKRMAELDLQNPQPINVLNEEKVRYSYYAQQFYSLLDTLDICHFVHGPAFQLYGPSQMVDVIRHITGWNVSLWELLKVGERRINMLRAFNAREGVGREQDFLPEKMHKPLSGGASDGVFISKEEVEEAKNLYYAMLGWDVATGKPGRAKLVELGLSWMADEIAV